jgi:hypothetical protein
MSDEISICDGDYDIDKKYIDCYAYPSVLTPGEIAIIKMFAEFDNG